jgi:hypothetical protein
MALYAMCDKYRASAVITSNGKDMTLKRMDNVLIVVDDLETTKVFFIKLGLTLKGEQRRRAFGRGADRARECPSHHVADS